MVTDLKKWLVPALAAIGIPESAITVDGNESRVANVVLMIDTATFDDESTEQTVRYALVVPEVDSDGDAFDHYAWQGSYPTEQTPFVVQMAVEAIAKQRIADALEGVHIDDIAAHRR